MAKVPFPERLTALSIGLGSGATAALLLAAGLVKATLNEYRAASAMESALQARGCGRTDLAGEAASRAAEAKPARCASPRLLLALQKLEAGDVPAAKAAYEALLADAKTPLTPRERAVLVSALGVIALRESAPPEGKPWGGPQVERARDLLREASDAWPELPEPLLDLAALELLCGRPDAARSLLAKADESPLPPSIEGARLRGRLRGTLALRDRKPEAALAEARAIRALRPGGDAERALEALALARVAEASGGGPHAGQATALLVHVDARFTPPGLLEHARARLALLEMARPQPDRNHLERLMGQSGRDAAFLQAVWACRVLAREGMSPAAAKDAVEPLRAAAALPGAPAALQANLGAALAASGKPAEAVPFLLKAAEAAPSDPRAALNLAVALDLAGDRPAALRWYDRSLSLRPGQPPAQARVQALRTGGGR